MIFIYSNLQNIFFKSAKETITHNSKIGLQTKHSHGGEEWKVDHTTMQQHVIQMPQSLDQKIEHLGLAGPGKNTSGAQQHVPNQNNEDICTRSMKLEMQQKN